MCVSIVINDKGTAVECGKRVHELYCEYYVRYIKDITLFGLVEIDKSLLAGELHMIKERRHGKKLWIWGLIERATNRLKLFPVENRNKVTLLKLIADNLQEGSIKWRMS